MSTVTTRLGGIAFRIVADADQWVGRFVDPPPDFPPVVFLGTTADRNRGMKAALDTVLQWQDANIADGSSHVSEHALHDIDVMLGVPDDGRLPVTECWHCRYWVSVLKQRLLPRPGSHGVTPLPVVTKAQPRQQVALFHKGRRVSTWHEEEPVQGPHGWVRLAHVEVIAPWGEVLCATAALSEIWVHPYRAVN
jgi:hypothetical protein